MPAERGVEPPLGEEDVAGALDLLQQIEAGPEVRFRRARPQRVMQEAEGGQHPRLAGAVGRVAQGGEERVPDGAVGRQRRHDELERRAAVRVVDPIALRGQDFRAARHAADREPPGDGREVPLGERHAGHFLLAPPDALEAARRRRRQRDVAVRSEPRGGQAPTPGRRGPAPQQRLDVRRQRRAARRRQVAPPGGREVAEDARDVLLVRLRRERAPRQVDQRLRVDLAFEQRIPERHPADGPRQGVAHVRQRFQQVVPGARVERHQPVAETAAGGEHVVGRGASGRLRNHRLRRAQVDRQRLRGTAGIPQHHVQTLIPEPPGARRIGLPHREAGDRVPVGLQRHLDPRPAALFHPRPAPGREVLGRPAVEDRDQVRPARVRVGVRRQVLAQAAAQRLLPDQPFQVGEDDRRLLVDDGPVKRPRLVQVVERLPDRIGAGGAVDAVRRRMVREQEPQAVVDAGERRVDDLRGQEVGERLLHPDVVEPRHGDEVAEPLVGGLVRDQAGPAEVRVLGGALVEQQRAGAVEDRARVLHPAVLEGGHEHEVELFERIRNAGVFLQPRQGRRVQIEDGAGIALHPPAVRLAVVHRHPPPAALGLLHLELARREGEQIAADRGRLRKDEPRPIAPRLVRRERAVGHRAPPGR